ncbi:MAG: hypothetical protein HXS53_01345 [Theionarchaea archaeon]|nr:hypothetical protein [Theionarchaea archaeon]
MICLHCLEITVVHGGNGLTDISSIKENVRAVRGVFLLQQGTLYKSDIDGISEQSLHHLSETISYWKETMESGGNEIIRMSILAEDYCFLFFQDSYTVGVITSEDVNVPFLSIIVNKMLELIKNEIKKEENNQLKLPKTFAQNSLSFTQPREVILAIAPRYARKVLEYVDGTRTIRDIVEESLLPAEMVLDVILTYTKASIITFNET